MEPQDTMSLEMDELARIASVRASFYSFINFPFVALPDLGFIQQIRNNEFLASLEGLAADQTLHPSLIEGVSLMVEFLRNSSGKEDSELSDELGVDRTRLYRGITPSMGPPPPYESVWTRGPKSTSDILLELATAYRQSSLAIEPGERQDYIGVELAFQQQLVMQEIEFWQTGEEEKAQDSLKQQDAFLKEHLNFWIPAFIENALPEAKTDFYRGQLLMLRGFLADEEEYFLAEAEEA